jgi:hypothetical protein
MGFSSSFAPPKEPVDPDYSWPLILLTDLDETRQAQLVRLVKWAIKKDLKSYYRHYFGNEFQGKPNSKVKIWSPPRQLLESIVAQGPERDSASNIHALAVLAYRSGRPRIIVADEATKRHLSGNHNPSFDDKHVISVILISVEKLHDDPDKIAVHVKRANCLPPPLSPPRQYEEPVGPDHPDDFDDSDSPEGPAGPSDTDDSAYDGSVYNFMHDDPVYGGSIQPPVFDSTNLYLGPLWSHICDWRGFIMHDPDQEPFTVGSAVLGRERYLKAVAAALSPSLPMELVINVSHTQPGPPKMPVWERRPSKTHLLILLLYHTTSEELHKTQSKIQDALPSIMEQIALDCGSGEEGFDYCDARSGRLFETLQITTVELIPRDRHRLRTRRELSAFWKQYYPWAADFHQNRKGVPLLYLSEPLSDLNTSQFGVINAMRGAPIMFWRTLPAIFMNLAMRGPLSTPSPDSKEMEMLYNPDQPCFLVEYLWQGMTDDTRSVVFLTNRLTKEQTQRLQEIRVRDESDDEESEDDESDDELGHEYVAVPWRNGKPGVTDGKVKDIWEIITNIYTFWTDDEDILFIFVDAQFARDETVILVRADEYTDCDPEHELLRHLPFSCLRGFRYIRVPIHLTGSRAKNEAIDGEWSSYRRPGWPSPGLLPNDEAQGVHVDGDSFP